MTSDEPAYLSFAVTSDGSNTLYNSQVGEHYHSRHGAVQESRHVFLGMGLEHLLGLYPAAEARILEVGFGTGLNFLVSAEYASQNKIVLSYTGIEAYPLPEEMIRKTGYSEFVGAGIWESFTANYSRAMNDLVPLDAHTKFRIFETELLSFTSDELFDVIYFDAFAAVHQPEMWSTESLSYICKFLRSGGIFVTYAITGDLKRAMKSLGFKIEKVPGAAGKREMLRARKE